MHLFFKSLSFLCLTVLFFNTPIEVFSQSKKISKNTIYVEGAGVGGYGSINYERICFLPTHSISKIGIAFRLGASTYYLNDYTNTFNPQLIFPIGVHLLYGKNSKIEVGAGQTITSFIQANTHNFQPERDINNHTYFVVGYRYQKDESGLMFRVAYTPLLIFNKYYKRWGGIAVGYTF
ncbi:hypothetical protein Fleli_2837 [Bernardetia litoralis DSM 6794]|uniref:Outer membrane protein beta-barrel domain-containing protein n=1 Tax=Bernardetia litoralis (strain ATCC 23117 / DSM 6794 / NBRC 15988 / NCIMB 1366 / Fx l1 / Sio-4) TaxID=880071 RepID=I4AMK5_BERLS|nr:hypothetical protein [Bernardetia litoralis]AFM05190.1 hypothetical protein Fleli_2837 [Bernardetia litoralis DSM 6794]